MAMGMPLRLSRTVLTRETKQARDIFDTLSLGLEEAGASQSLANLPSRGLESYALEKIILDLELALLMSRSRMQHCLLLRGWHH